MPDGYPAARGLDPITHSVELCGLIGGSLIGAVVGGLIIGATIASGGALIVAAGLAAGAIGMGGLSGGNLARGLQTVFHIPNPKTGVLRSSASPNVWVGKARSARAGQDVAISCHGLWCLAHLWSSSVKIAEGSKTVTINGHPAARVTSKLTCGAAIEWGEDTVIIGGPTIRLLKVHDMEAELRAEFELMMGLSLLVMPEMVLLLPAFEVISALLDGAGNAIGPGWSDILQGTFGFAMLGLAAKGALDAAPKETLETAAREGGQTRSAADAARLKEHLRQSEKYGDGGVRALENGRIRYYGEMEPASKPGPMAGRRLVREWDPYTGQKRTWHETLDHSGRVRQVRPDESLTGGTKRHFRFDENGSYTGSW